MVNVKHHQCSTNPGPIVGPTNITPTDFNFQYGLDIDMVTHMFVYRAKIVTSWHQRALLDHNGKSGIPQSLETFVPLVLLQIPPLSLHVGPDTLHTYHNNTYYSRIYNTQYAMRKMLHMDYRNMYMVIN